VKRHADTAEVAHFTELDEIEFRLSAKPQAKDVLTFPCREILPVSSSSVIGMSMRDDCTLDWYPRVDIEVARIAVQTTAGQFQQLSHAAHTKMLTACVLGPRRLVNDKWLGSAIVLNLEFGLKREL
jgi:hypothetical protein